MTQEPSTPFNPDEAGTWEALARYLAGSSPAAEVEAVRAWLAEEPARADLLGALDRATRTLAFRAPPGLDVEAALRAVRARLDEPEVRPLGHRLRRAPERWVAPWRTTPFRVAATIALVLGAAWIWRLTAGREGARAPVLEQAFATPVGRTDSLRLPDGSLVLLGPGSDLTVAAGYGADRREVALHGQALFDVLHDPDRPFTVRAAHALIVDLGTAFTVRTDEEENVHVVVTAGSVLLNAASAAPDRGVVLSAGDRGALDAAGRAVAERGAGSDDDLAWTRGRLVFDDAPLTRVAADLRRWYGIELILTDPAFAERHLTATFEGEAVPKVLEVIGLAIGARIEQRGDSAFVRPLPEDARR